MSPDNDDDDPTDGGTPKCKAAFDAYTDAEDDWEKARDELHDAEFENEVDFEWMIMTCDNFGFDSDACMVEMFSALEAVHRLGRARDAARVADSARYGAAFLVADCLSDHKFHGNVWLPS